LKKGLKIRQYSIVMGKEYTRENIYNFIHYPQSDSAGCAILSAEQLLNQYLFTLRRPIRDYFHFSKYYKLFGFQDRKQCELKIAFLVFNNHVRLISI